jgi:hypothetical protein
MSLFSFNLYPFACFYFPFRIFSRGIVLPYRTTTGPTSEFEKPLSFNL